MIKIQNDFDSLIFGGSGQDGFFMSRFLIKKKKKILVILRKKDNKYSLLSKKYKKFIQIKVCKKFTKSNYINFFKKNIFKNIFFFAGFSKIPHNTNEKKKCREANYHIFKFLLEACLELKIFPKILYTSSSEIFGTNQKSPKKENSRLKAENCYAECKIKSVNLINYYRENHNFFIVNAICYNHESIFSPNDHLINKIIRLLKEKKTSSIKIYNSEDIRNISHAYDFLPIFEKSLIKSKCGDYIFANSQNVTIKKIINILNKKFNKKIIYSTNKKMRISRTADNQKLRKEFNYSPIYNTRQLLTRMLSYSNHRLKLNEIFN
jgi:GDPmannose 4,6-dehydratase